MNRLFNDCSRKELAYLCAADVRNNLVVKCIDGKCSDKSIFEQLHKRGLLTRWSSTYTINISSRILLRELSTLDKIYLLEEFGFINEATTLIEEVDSAKLFTLLAHKNWCIRLCAKKRI